MDSSIEQCCLPFLVPKLPSTPSKDPLAVLELLTLQQNLTIGLCQLSGLASASWSSWGLCKEVTSGHSQPSLHPLPHKEPPALLCLGGWSGSLTARMTLKLISV